MAKRRRLQLTHQRDPKQAAHYLLWGGHGRRIALVGGAVEGELTLLTPLMEEMMGRWMVER
jgi:hypothetical protein